MGVSAASTVLLVYHTPRHIQANYTIAQPNHSAAQASPWWHYSLATQVQLLKYAKNVLHKDNDNNTTAWFVVV